MRNVQHMKSPAWEHLDPAKCYAWLELSRNFNGDTCYDFLYASVFRIMCKILFEMQPHLVRRLRARVVVMLHVTHFHCQDGLFSKEKKFSKGENSILLSQSGRESSAKHMRISPGGAPVRRQLQETQ